MCCIIVIYPPPLNFNTLSLYLKMLTQNGVFNICMKSSEKRN